MYNFPKAPFSRHVCRKSVSVPSVCVCVFALGLSGEHFHHGVGLEFSSPRGCNSASAGTLKPSSKSQILTQHRTAGLSDAPQASVYSWLYLNSLAL